MMNKTKTGGIIISLALLMSCVSATVNEPDVCSTNDLGTVPGAPVAGVSVPALSFSTPSDISDVLGKIKDVSDSATITVNSLSLTGDSDLSWISGVDLSIKGDSPDLPEALFASYHSSGSPSGASLPLEVKMDTGTVEKYLNHPVTMTFTVSGVSTTQSVKLTNTMCVGVSGEFSKSL